MLLKPSCFLVKDTCMWTLKSINAWKNPNFFLILTKKKKNNEQSQAKEDWQITIGENICSGPSCWCVRHCRDEGRNLGLGWPMAEFGPCVLFLFTTMFNKEKNLLWSSEEQQRLHCSNVSVCCPKDQSYGRPPGNQWRTQKILTEKLNPNKMQISTCKSSFVLKAVHMYVQRKGIWPVVGLPAGVFRDRLHVSTDWFQTKKCS